MINNKNHTLNNNYNDLCIFLRKYSFLFDFKIIDFFTKYKYFNNNSVFTFLRNLDYDDLNRIPHGYIDDNWPNAVVSFLNSAVNLGNERFNYKKPNIINKLEYNLLTGMSLKKRHEVERMTSFVHQIASENHINKIVDAGSGMGYISRILAEKYKYSVLALEGNQCIAEKSLSFIQHPGSSKFSCHNFVLNSSKESIIQLDLLLRNNWPEISESDGICLVGLHSCADLTPCMISIFKQLKYMKVLICVSCCYHRMKTIDGINYENFPLSDIFINIFKNLNFQLNQFGLRLAAQETRTKWQTQSIQDHHFHLKCFAFRCIIEICNSRYTFQLQKKSRKFIRGSLYNFEAFLNSQGYNTEISTILMEIYDEYKDNFDIIEPFTMLQVLFQPILEYLITNDRTEYIKQSGFSNTEPYLIFDDLISPRNIAIVSIK